MTSCNVALAFRRDVLSQVLPMPEDITITADNYIKFAAHAGVTEP